MPELRQMAESAKKTFPGTKKRTGKIPVRAVFTSNAMADNPSFVRSASGQQTPLLF